MITIELLWFEDRPSRAVVRKLSTGFTLFFLWCPNYRPSSWLYSPLPLTCYDMLPAASKICTPTLCKKTRQDIHDPHTGNHGPRVNPGVCGV